MYLKFYANHMKGVQVILCINLLQCNGLSQIHSGVFLQAENSTYDR